ncbi:MAG: DUF3048 C-terminal domain-containing protein [Chloroflexi bacterium]|nr:DUF3048 C-terminal domain-containing protein [Chloroflexota bacterium]
MRTLFQPISKKSHFVWLAIGAVLLAGCVGAGNFVWLDENGNGVQDGAEPGIEGVSVTLFKADGTVLGSTTTDASGSYQIVQQGIASGSFYLDFGLPGGYEHTLQDQGGDDELDSDASPSSGETSVLTLSGIDDSVDAGLILVDEVAVALNGEEPTATPTPTPTPVPEPESGATGLEQVCYGPGPENFPEGISPLTGLPVNDPSLLALRPVFLSISIFPPSVRPPTGLSVSPIVYELYIGEGDTRLMAGFYGEFPQPAYQGEGGEGSPAPQNYDYLIGDWVWFDSNGNHLQDEGEPGVPDVPVSLLDSNFNVVQETTTDALGNYYFALSDLAVNSSFQIRFGAPPSIRDYYWVNKNIGDDAIDSDATELGRTDFFDPTDEEPGQQLDLDAGLRQAYRIEGLRSGRVAYQDLQINYCGCLVTAGADPTVAAQINTCASAFGNDPGNIGGAGLDVSRLQAIATNNSQGSCAEPNLTGNLFCTLSGIAGLPGQELFVEYNINNVDHFVYDPELGAYSWAKNLPSAPETFEVMTDRLTGETLTFENVILLLTQHTSQNSAGTIINLDMNHKTGTAFIFRNGQAYEALWTTVATEYEQTSGHPLPVRFTDLDGNPFPLAPGQIWVNLLNAFDSVEMDDSGIWSADFDAPPNP